MRYLKGTHLLILISLFLFIIGCVDRKEQWIEHYAQAKCAWQKEENALTSDSLKLIAPLAMEMKELLREKEEIANLYENKIDVLKNQIKDEEKQYKKEYRKLTDTHNEKYGHVSTSEYEKSLMRIQQNRDNRIALIQKKIKEISDELLTYDKYQNLLQRIALIESKIKEQDSVIQNSHKPVFDSLQNELDNLNSNYKRIMSDLTNEEKMVLESTRDSIRKNPCLHERK